MTLNFRCSTHTYKPGHVNKLKINTMISFLSCYKEINHTSGIMLLNWPDKFNMYWDYKSTIVALARQQKCFRNIPSNMLSFSNNECLNLNFTALNFIIKIAFCFAAMSKWFYFNVFKLLLYNSSLITPKTSKYCLAISFGI